VLDGIASHEGVGFLMVRSGEHGPVVFSSKGRNYLAEERVEGEDPLAGFGPRAADHLLREDSFSNCPDILVNSFYNVDANEVAAFEELIGCHGGMGGYQTQPFLLYPADWQLEEDQLVGAASVYRQLKNWLGQFKPSETSYSS
jgi:putative membrane protein